MCKFVEFVEGGVVYVWPGCVNKSLSQNLNDYLSQDIELDRITWKSNLDDSANQRFRERSESACVEPEFNPFIIVYLTAHCSRMSIQTSLTQPLKRHSRHLMLQNCWWKWRKWLCDWYLIDTFNCIIWLCQYYTI